MKKRVLSCVFVLAFLLATGVGMQKNLKSNLVLSELALANVEALAFYEGAFDDLAALCEWAEYQYCQYYVTFPDGNGYYYSHWNLKNR